MPERPADYEMDKRLVSVAVASVVAVANSCDSHDAVTVVVVGVRAVAGVAVAGMAVVRRRMAVARVAGVAAVGVAIVVRVRGGRVAAGVIVSVSDDLSHDGVAVVVASVVAMSVTDVGNVVSMSVVGEAASSGGGSEEGDGEEHSFKLN